MTSSQDNAGRNPVSSVRSRWAATRSNPRVVPPANVDTPAPASSQCTSSTTLLSFTHREILVLRVVGEIDLSTIARVQGMLTAALAQRPSHLIVDLARVTFCSVRGLAMLIEIQDTAAGHDVGYAISAASAQSERVWAMFWATASLPPRYDRVWTAALAMACDSLSEVARGGDSRQPPRNRGLPKVADTDHLAFDVAVNIETARSALGRAGPPAAPRDLN